MPLEGKGSKCYRHQHVAHGVVYRLAVHYILNYKIVTINIKISVTLDAINIKNFTNAS